MVLYRLLDLLYATQTAANNTTHLDFVALPTIPIGIDASSLPRMIVVAILYSPLPYGLSPFAENEVDRLPHGAVSPVGPTEAIKHQISMMTSISYLTTTEDRCFLSLFSGLATAGLALAQTGRHTGRSD
jgi:hypothetical protein